MRSAVSDGLKLENGPGLKREGQIAKKGRGSWKTLLLAFYDVHMYSNVFYLLLVDFHVLALREAAC